MNKPKRSVETMLFTTGNAAVVADGATALVSSTGVCNLSSGQIGFFDVGGYGSNSNNVAINTGDTVVESPRIIVAQGTPYSATPGATAFAGFFRDLYEKSHDIIGRNIKLFSGKAYVAPRTDAWAIGADDAAADAIGTPLDLTEYTVRVTFRGRKRDERNSDRMRQSTLGRYTTLDYTTLGTTNPLDHLIQHLVHDLNKDSRAIVTNGVRGTLPFVAFAVNTGSVGTFSGSGEVLFSDLDNLDGAVATGYGFSTDAETAAANNNSQMALAFAALIADTNSDFDTDSEVVPIDLTLAGTHAIGANAIAIIALDEELSYVEHGKQTKVKLEVSLPDGFLETVGVYSAGSLREGDGVPRVLEIMYRNTVSQRKYSQNRELFPVIAAPDYVVDTEIYDTYIIETWDTHVIGTDSPDETSPQRCYIFVPSADTTTKNSLEAVLNAYFAPLGIPAVNI